MPSRAKKSGTPAAAVDAQLARYREMRDFGQTAEPRGDMTHAPPGGLPFVVQKHAASRLHYDFRLGWNGVLKSWAVAKGPSYVVADKRLAVQVEDHPMEYGGFEGTIPKGQYGGGTVMLWDTGTWEPVGDPEEGFRTGRLKFILHGRKLKGRWTLVRMHGRAAQESKPNWLLIKEHDDYERGPDDPAIVDEEPDSAVTGRGLDAIARDADHVWDSRTGLADDERAKQSGRRGDSLRATAMPDPMELDIPRAAIREALPKFIEPELATLAQQPPGGASWVHELKMDGYRIQARIDRGKVQLLTRSGLDWTARMRPLAVALKLLPVTTALLDGEVVVLDAHGISSFAMLQAAFQEDAQHTLDYYVFDLLHLDGRSLRALPLVERKTLLNQLLNALADDSVRFSEDLRHDGVTVFHEACRHGAEGIISKRADGPYISGRSPGWLKIKCGLRQELVIGGFTLPTNGSHGVGSLLLGYYRDGKLIYAGRAGSGFTQKQQTALRSRLDDLRATANPFLAIGTAERKGAIWVRPRLVAEIAFSNWTADNLVRQASFKGLREDKPAKDVVREAASVIPNARSAAAARIASQRRIMTDDDSPLLPRITHPDKVIDPSSGLTKQQLVAYYAEAATAILPFIANRPLSIVRCPSGTAAKCFFQKHAKPGLPKRIGSVEIIDQKTGEPEPYITVSDASVIPDLGQLNVFELHPWAALATDVEHPDRIIFDLDPDTSIDWPTLAATAAEVRDRLQQLGLAAFLKSTGGKGLHIVAPIRAEHDWPTVKQFAHNFVLRMEAESPALYITKMTKSARAGRIYLDYLRNERGATAVAPYSPRSRPGVPVSVPMEWSELKLQQSLYCTVSNLDDWRGRLIHDPWADLLKTRQRLTQKAIAGVSAKR